MRRPKSAPKLDPNNPHSAVYLAARQEWNERYGSYIAAARTWRLMAFGAITVAGLAVGGFIYDRGRNHAVPYIIEVNRLGESVPVRRADEVGPLDPRIIRAQLARWVNNMRVVYTDLQAQRQAINEAYAFINSGTAAAQLANEWFQRNPPWKRAETETVSINVESVLPLSPNTWQVEWNEEVRGRNGTLSQREYWRASVTFSVIPQTADASIAQNFYGLFIDTYSWTRRQ